jgi:ABC-type bacteriocin/lantibiotic exporter with double-glycine peptidase domain
MRQILQSAAAECGLASLAMIADHHGLRLDLADLRRKKQRVLLARALYKQCRILALDEAMSHLDFENERLVNQAVKSLALTRITIAHRPETMANASRVVALEGGS